MCAHFGCSYNIFIYRTWKPYSPMHCGIETDCCQIRTWSSLATIPDKMECKIVDIAIGLSARRMRWCQQTLATLKSCDSKRAKLRVVLAWEETKITTGLGCTIFLLCKSLSFLVPKKCDPHSLPPAFILSLGASQKPERHILWSSIP